MAKVYFKQSVANGLYWYINLDDKHLTLRFAGNPSFLLEKYVEKHGVDEGRIRYQEVLEMLNEVGNGGKSPFVLYVNNLNPNN